MLEVRRGGSLGCLLFGLLGLLALLLLFENNDGGGNSLGGKRQSQKKSLCWSEESYYCEGCRMISL